MQEADRNNPNHQHSTPDSDWLTLSEVARCAPGRPSANCIWRWCRKGIQARDGDRITLKHVRLGGKIFSKRSWLEDFGNQLAEADARYFEMARASENARSSRRHHSRVCDRDRTRLDAIEAELDKAGL